MQPSCVLFYKYMPYTPPCSSRECCLLGDAKIKKDPSPPRPSNPLEPRPLAPLSLCLKAALLLSAHLLQLYMATRLTLPIEAEAFCSCAPDCLHP